MSKASTKSGGPAVRYAMVMMAVSLKDLIIFGNAGRLEKAVPLDDDHLREELPRVFLRYLGVKGE